MSNVTPGAEASIRPGEIASQQGAAFTWTFSGAPIRVRFPLPLVARLRSELNQLANKRDGSSETGGVLIGSQKSASVIEIEDYRWVLAESPKESRFQLNTGVLKRLRSGRTGSDGSDEAEGDELPTSPVLGYFRTQAGGGLRLRAEELSVVHEQFADSSNIVLVIDIQSKPYNAGFFFWMESNAFTPFSLRDFPLDPEILALQEQPAGVTPRRPASAPAPVEISGASIADETMEASSAALPMMEEPPARPPLPALAIGLGLAAIAMGGVAILNLGLRPSNPTAVPAPAASPLRLEVEEQGGGLNVRWNSQIEAIREARAGTLEVREGDQPPQVIPLDRQQLAAGHVFYRSPSARLQFDLAVVSDGGVTTRDSVLALSPKPAGNPPARPVDEPTPGTGHPAPPAAKPVTPPSPKPAPAARVLKAPLRRLPAGVPSLATDRAPSLPVARSLSH